MRECTIPMGISRANASKNCSKRPRERALFGSFVWYGEGSLLLPVGELSVFCSGLSVRFWQHFGSLRTRSADEAERRIAFGCNFLSVNGSDKTTVNL